MRRKNNNRESTLRIAFGAIIVALFVVSYLIIPIGERTLQSFIMIVSPIPISLYTCKFDLKNAVLVLLSSIVISVVVIQPFVLVAYTIPSAIMGVLIGFIDKKEKRIISCMSISMMHFLQNLFEISLFYRMTDNSFLGTYKSSVLETIDLFSSLIKNQQALTVLEDVLICSLPIIMIVSSIIKGIMTYLVFGEIKKRLLTNSKPVFVTKEYNGGDKQKVYRFIYLGYALFFVSMCVLWLLVMLHIIEYVFIYGLLLTVFLLYALIIYALLVKIIIQGQKTRLKKTFICFLLLAVFPLADLPFAICSLLNQKE